MAVLHFDKAELGNLEYSLVREMLSTNRSGGYLSTTIICCNTRKYHGLMVCPIEEFANEEFVLLSSLDETIIQHDQRFNLAIHRFPGTYEPRGHKYITDFSYTPTPTITYRVGGVILKKELLWVHTAQQLLIRYTLVEAHSQTRLHLRPFLAFRNRHSLSKENMMADGRSYPIDGGVKSRLYPGFPWLNMQTSRDAAFVAVPDWYQNFEYQAEKKRGYPSTEDLLTTGYFELELKAGQSVVFSASTTTQNPDKLAEQFEQEIERRTNKTEFLPLMRHSARQFLIHYDGGVALNAGYPWYNPRSRETFIALPGCTLSQDLNIKCKEILDRHVARLHNGLFGTHLAADTQLWFFHTLSELEKTSGAAEVWSSYGCAMKEILETYRSGNTPEHCIAMSENGLIYSALAGKALTWMNINIDGTPITRRPGYTVETNALWYNAVRYTLSLAKQFGDDKFVDQWQNLAPLIQDSFQHTFYLKDRKYCADYVYEGFQNTDIRPNQLMACSLKYSPLIEEQKWAVLETVRAHLLTSRGIRTLTPLHPAYQGRMQGNQDSRDSARHNGTAFPWLLEHYVRARFILEGSSFTYRAQELLAAFEEELLTYGIGSVAEVYDGDPPHNPNGAISYSPSVGAILAINAMIEQHS